MSAAAILLAHGSPRPQWAEPAVRVREALRARRPDLVVELAFLPPAQPDLARVIDDLVARSITRMTVLPLLLSGGGRHLGEDVPRTLEALRARHPGLDVALCETALGSTDEVVGAFAAAADRLLG